MVEPPSLSYRDNAPQPHSRPLGLLTLLTVGLIVAFLYFARDVIVRSPLEISSPALQLPEYRANLEAKLCSLPAAVPGGGALRRTTSMVQELGRELKQSASQSPVSALDRSAAGTSGVEPTKPVRGEIQRPELEPLHVVQTLSGRAEPRPCGHR